MSQRRNGRAPDKGSYDLVGGGGSGNQQMPGGGDEDQDLSFTETDHIRSSVVRLAGGLGDDRAPTAQEGMMRRPGSLAADTSLEIAMLESGAGTAADSPSPSRYQIDREKNEEQSFRQSDAYREAERDVMRRTLEEINKVANKRIRDGFSEVNFTLGVLNVILVSFTFALWPQHFWLLFLVEGILFVGAKSRTFWRSKPLNNILYLLDYCWVMNILALFVLIFFVLDGLLLNPSGEALHRQVFMSSLGTACGPLLGACFILPFVCCLFHDINTLSDLFIHIFPPMVAFTLKWESAEIQQAWPNIFLLDYTDEVSFFPNESSSFFSCVVGSTITLYLVWFVLFTAWMLIIGIDMPRSDRIGPDGQQIVPTYDTVFHSLMRGGLYIITGSTFFGRNKAISVDHMNANNFYLGDLFVYLGAHAFLSILATVLLGYLCFHSKAMHGFLLAAVTAVVVYRGALRYTYYTTEMYSKTLRKQFAHLLEEDG
mmetsp:Transcript_12450/g.35644  ORF Transcript_12450/g.35644 Transcript_12450/m.35644 type:complete len:484 (+) Transcript_12450:111-1562(+)